MRPCGKQPERGQPGDGFAGAGLADEAERLAALESEIDAMQHRYAVEGDASGPRC